MELLKREHGPDQDDAHDRAEDEGGPHRYGRMAQAAQHAGG